uniref:Uncharacterized protein n=1 Tax=Glossina brevipalpis TaxID=37001 RepID=A0A1A9WXF7_9MUSC
MDVIKIGHLETSILPARIPLGNTMLVVVLVTVVEVTLCSCLDDDAKRYEGDEVGEKVRAGCCFCAAFISDRGRCRRCTYWCDGAWAWDNIFVLAGFSWSVANPLLLLVAGAFCGRGAKMADCGLGLIILVDLNDNGLFCLPLLDDCRCCSEAVSASPLEVREFSLVESFLRFASVRALRLSSRIRSPLRSLSLLRLSYSSDSDLMALERRLCRFSVLVWLHSPPPIEMLALPTLAETDRFTFTPVLDSECAQVQQPSLPVIADTICASYHSIAHGVFLKHTQAPIKANIVPNMDVIITAMRWTSLNKLDTSGRSV